MTAMETIILTQRVKPHQREELENEPSAVELRRECCNGTKYDIPSQGSICSVRAKSQCKIQGPHKYYFTEVIHNDDGSRKVLQAAHDEKDRLIVNWQEPLEKNPGPIGLDLFSLPARAEAFWESDATGQKGVTKRMVRVFASNREFGVLVWNNVFVCNTTDGNKTLSQGVQLGPKAKILETCNDPYSIGSVVAVYKPQVMLSSAISKIFTREVTDTKLFLFDNRPTTEERQRLLAYYDQSITPVAMNEEAMRISEQTIEELTQSDDVQLNNFAIPGTNNVEFLVAAVPNDSFMDRHTSKFPVVILILSLVLVGTSQIERWLGHPAIISQSALARAKWEQLIRAEIEREIADVGDETQP
jgi:hypothetical protein